jgi:ribokinase
MSNPGTETSAHCDVVIVGSFVQDHVWLTDQFPYPGETRRAQGFSTGPGGKGFNQAVSCARQGASVTFIGSIGQDGLGAGAKAFAEGEQIRSIWQEHTDVPTAAAGIIVNEHGANQIMVSLAANECLDVAFLRAQATRFAGARVLLVQLENNLDAIECALSLGRSQGLLCVLNPAPVHRDLSRTILDQCDVLTPNETEFSLLLAQFADEHLASDQVAATADAELHRLCRRLGNMSVIITLGAAGCFVSHSERGRLGESESFYRHPAERVEAVDTTGAGDAFNGALVAALAQKPDKPLREAIKHAGRVAALSTEKIGAALAMPTRAEVIARFA